MNRLFTWAGKPRSLWVLLGVTLLSGAAMLPALKTMSDHGASLIAFENAGTVSRIQEILADWGDPGKTAAWWQLGLDMPFLVGYGLFIAGACAAVARRARRVGRPRLERVAAMVAWSGPLAAASDLFQNVSLALVLAGHETQPWPRISAVCGTTISVFMATGLIFALGGVLVTRRAPTPAPSGPAGETE